MDTTNLIIVVVIFGSLIYLSTKMMGRDKESSSDLWNDILRGFSIDSNDNLYETILFRRRLRNGLMILFGGMILLSLFLLDGSMNHMEYSKEDTTDLITVVVLVLLCVIVPGVLVTVDNSVTRKQKDERDTRIKSSPPNTELIDSVESYRSFMTRENLMDKGIISRAGHISRLSRDIVDGKRNVVFDTRFLEDEEVSRDMRNDVNWLKDGLEIGVEHESNPIYSRFYRRFSSWVLLIMCVITLGGWLLSMCSSD